MATLPDVSAIRPVARPSRGISSISPGAAGAVGGAISDLGAVANQMGMQILDREATAAAKDADTAAADKIRALLYDPETGFANLQGGNAVAAREKVSAQIEQIMQSSMEGLNKEAQRKLKDSLDARRAQALSTIDGHTSDQRRVWVDGARDARIQSSYQDILADPSRTDAELLRIEGEIRGRAVDKGWSQEEAAAELGKAKSTVYRGVAEKIALVDPEGAAAYLQQNRDKMLGSDVADLEAKLIPMAKDAEGRRLGEAAAGGLPTYSYDTRIEYAMGPHRPNKPNQPILDVVGRSAEDVFGKGARVVVVSGKENEGDQYGSNRHKTGNAADIAIYRPDGTQVRATDPDMAAFAKNAAKNGATGIGFGAEYMGGDHIHVDLVGTEGGGGHVWSSGAKAIAGELVAEMDARKASGNTGASGLLTITDPRIRASAFDTFNLVSSVRAGEVKAAAAAASNAAFAAITNGGSVRDMTPEQQQAIGQDGVDALIRSEALLKSGSPVETDLSVYAKLRQQAIDDPLGFKDAANSGFAPYADKLSEGDRKSLVDMATSPTAKSDAWAASTLTSIAERQLRGLGIKAGDAREGVVQSRLLQWQDGYMRANGGNAPPQSEIDQQVGRMLTNVVIDPPGAFNEISGQAFSIDSPIDVGGETVPASVVNETVNAMISEGLEVNYDTLSARLLALMGGD